MTLGFQKKLHNYFEKEERQPRRINLESLDIFWLKDKSLTDTDNLPDPEILAEEIIEDMEAGLSSLKELMETLGKNETAG